MIALRIFSSTRWKEGNWASKSYFLKPETAVLKNQKLMMSLKDLLYLI